MTRALSHSKHSIPTQPQDYAPSRKLFITSPSQFPQYSDLPPAGQPAPQSIRLHSRKIKCIHAGAVIHFIFSLGFLCSVPGSFVRPSVTPNCCTCASIETPLPLPARPAALPRLHPPRHPVPSSPFSHAQKLSSAREEC